MSQKHQLISGTFRSSEALSIIMSFYNHKINYHNIQLLTAMERNDSDIDIIQQKLKELQNTSEVIRKVLTEGINRDHEVEITSFIEINLDPLLNVR